MAERLALARTFLSPMRLLKGKIKSFPFHFFFLFSSMRVQLNFHTLLWKWKFNSKKFLVIRKSFGSDL